VQFFTVDTLVKVPLRCHHAALTRLATHTTYLLHSSAAWLCPARQKGSFFHLWFWNS